MPDKIFLRLLLICIIWSQEISSTVANGEIRESSDNLVRQKRVVSHVPGEDVTVPISRFPYIVRIRRYARVNCVGNILSQHVVITAALCVEVRVTEYFVISGASRVDNGDKHDVTDIKTRFGNHPDRPADGIALLTVDPPFVFGITTNKIQLHSGPLLPNTIATISGWGYYVYRTTNSGTCHPRSLRSIQVPIMAHRECVNIYRPINVQISDVDICTYHPQRRCGHTDGGAPLIVDGYLAGVHLWAGSNTAQNIHEYPDVFAVLQDSVYIQWIMSNI